MADRLSVENQAILEKAQDLAHAIARYRELGENPLEETLEHLGNMDSSFTERIGRMLGNLTDKNPDFLENMEAIRDTAAEIANNLREVDTEIASSMGGTS